MRAMFSWNGSVDHGQAVPVALVGGTVLAAIWVLAGAAAVPVRAALVINEVLYDPAGADAGAEWVEILNTGPVPVPLHGVRLEAGDGSAAGRWTLYWEGADGLWIEPGGFLVVGGPYRGRDADAPGLCGLQNGPDAVRLTLDGLELDRVGWGEHTFYEYAEGRSSTAVASGRSLARVPDGVDTEDNSVDFRAREPSPGRPNAPACDLSVRWRARRGLPVPAGAAGVAATLVLANHGSEPCSMESVRLYADGMSVLPDGGQAAGMLAAGDSLAILQRLPVPVSAGRLHWEGRVSLAADVVPENDVDTLRLWGDQPPAAFSEVSPRPGAEWSEWFELRIGAAGAWRPAGWTVEDASGASVTLLARASPVASGYAVVARDSSLVPAGGPGPRDGAAGPFLRWEGRWPSLNDSEGDDGTADTLFLRDPDGVIADWAVWGDTKAGEVWTRLPSVPGAVGLDCWVVGAGAEAATPGRAAWPGSSRPSLSSTKRLGPAGLSLERNPEGAWFRLPDGPAGTPWRLRVLDLRGEELWCRTGEREGSGVSRIRWAACDPQGMPVPAGVVVVEAAFIDGEGRRRLARETTVIGR